MFRQSFEDVERQQASIPHAIRLSHDTGQATPDQLGPPSNIDNPFRTSFPNCNCGPANANYNALARMPTKAAGGILGGKSEFLRRSAHPRDVIDWHSPRDATKNGVPLGRSLVQLTIQLDELLCDLGESGIALIADGLPRIADH